jgi:hypothetical protein
MIVFDNYYFICTSAAIEKKLDPWGQIFFTNNTTYCELNLGKNRGHFPHISVNAKRDNIMDVSTPRFQHVVFWVRESIFHTAINKIIVQGYKLTFGKYIKKV